MKSACCFVKWNEKRIAFVRGKLLTPLVSWGGVFLSPPYFCIAPYPLQVPHCWPLFPHWVERAPMWALGVLSTPPCHLGWWWLKRQPCPLGLTLRSRLGAGGLSRELSGPSMSSSRPAFISNKGAVSLHVDLPLVLPLKWFRNSEGRRLLILGHSSEEGTQGKRMPSHLRQREMEGGTDRHGKGAVIDHAPWEACSPANRGAGEHPDPFSGELGGNRRRRHSAQSQTLSSGELSSCFCPH